MKDKINYKILKTIKPSFDSKNKYLVIKVKGTIFSIKENRFRDYIIGCAPELWQKVNDWIDEYVLPYMTKQAINYKNSDDVATRCEFHLGQDIPHEIITIILASKGVKGENLNCYYEYPTLLYYPMSKEFDKVTMKGVFGY